MEIQIKKIIIPNNGITDLKNALKSNQQALRDLANAVGETKYQQTFDQWDKAIATIKAESNNPADVWEALGSSKSYLETTQDIFQSLQERGSQKNPPLVEQAASQRSALSQMQNTIRNNLTQPPTPPSVTKIDILLEQTRQLSFGTSPAEFIDLLGRFQQLLNTGTIFLTAAEAEQVIKQLQTTLDKLNNPPDKDPKPDLQRQLISQFLYIHDSVEQVYGLLLTSVATDDSLGIKGL